MFNLSARAIRILILIMCAIAASVMLCQDLGVK